MSRQEMTKQVPVKTIKELLAGDGAVQGVDIDKHWNVEFQGLAIDSRTVRAGDVFLAYQGHTSDGREYIQAAIDKGAVAVVAEKNKHWKEFTVLNGKTPVYIYPELRKKAGVLAAKFFGNPSASMKVIGITGTNGKTTCSHILAEALALLNKKCGIIGTLGNGFCGQLQTATHTTPDPVSLQKTVKDLKEAGAEFLAIEVSSHALDQGRVNGMNFDTAVLTNITHDHLDYHGTLEHYAEAKKSLFHWETLHHAVLNLDDEFGQQWLSGIGGTAKGVLHCIGYSRKANTEQLKTARFNQNEFDQLIASNIVSNEAGISFDFNSPRGDGHVSNKLMFGEFNISNLLAVSCVLFSAGFELEEIEYALSNVHGVPGRMEKINTPGKPTVVIDFAHTPDALENVLSALKSQKKGQLICVFGCGGDRDREKRPAMGRIASELADKVIVTSDNPRSEAKGTIFQDILSGISDAKRVSVIESRAEAITHAIALSQEGDVVLVAGKGAESYQEIDGKKLPYSDIEVIRDILNPLNPFENGALH